MLIFLFGAGEGKRPGALFPAISNHTPHRLSLEYCFLTSERSSNILFGFSLSLERDLLAKWTQIVDLLQYKAKAALQICRKLSYESGDKCGKVLARTLRGQKLKTYIPQVALSNRPKVKKPRDIAQEFREFYKSLYNLQVKPPTQAQIDSYLSSSLMPRLSDIDRDTF